jgi:electron transport complex protein RnfC
MLEQPTDVVDGLRLIMKAVGVDQGYIGVEENKPDAIAALEEACAADPGLTVVPLHVKYPQGLELQLIKAILDREVPSGKLPADVGVIVNNVGTAAAIAQAVRTGRPLTERVVTVSGSMVEHPKNLLVRIGTPFQSLLEECGLKG